MRVTLTKTILVLFLLLGLVLGQSADGTASGEKIDFDKVDMQALI